MKSPTVGCIDKANRLEFQSDVIANIPFSQSTVIKRKYNLQIKQISQNHLITQLRSRTNTVKNKTRLKQIETTNEQIKDKDKYGSWKQLVNRRYKKNFHVPLPKLLDIQHQLEINRNAYSSVKGFNRLKNKFSSQALPINSVSQKTRINKIHSFSQLKSSKKHESFNNLQSPIKLNIQTQSNKKDRYFNSSMQFKYMSQPKSKNNLNTPKLIYNQFLKNSNINMARKKILSQSKNIEKSLFNKLNRKRFKHQYESCKQIQESDPIGFMTFYPKQKVKRGCDKNEDTTQIGIFDQLLA